MALPQEGLKFAAAPMALWTCEKRFERTSILLRDVRVIRVDRDLNAVPRTQPQAGADTLRNHDLALRADSGLGHNYPCVLLVRKTFCRIRKTERPHATTNGWS
jgi:hypothetical protein